MAQVNLNVYHFLSQHCTNELLSMIDLTIKCSEENIWNIEDFINKNGSFFDILKILFVFEKGGGVLQQGNHFITFAELLRSLDNIQNTLITTYWYHNEANGVLPVYDLGELAVPHILPVFVAAQKDDGTWCVERLYRGEYVPLRNEIYPQEQTAKGRAIELNSNL